MLAGADLWGWMALVRARNIKPGLFKNDLLAETGLAGRVLFIGLWCMADREGRLEDRPRRIKAEVLPFDNCDVEDLLSQLEERDFLVRYEVNGQRFIQIANFVKHQRPHHKEVASEIPPPPGHVDSGVIPGGPTEEQRLRIFERDGWRCLECGSTEDLHIDHIIPRAKGGGHEDSNLQTLCRRCNLAKSDRMVEPTTDQVQPKLDPSMGQEQAEHGSSRSPLNPLIPDTGYLNADTGYLIAEEAREDAPPPPPDDAPSADVVETAEILVKAPWVGDDLPDVIRQVARSFELVDGFQPRDGPLEAEGYAMWRGYRKKPPSNWYQAWLNWIKRARKDATTNRRNGSGRYSDPAAEEPVEFVGVRRRIVDR